MRQLHAQRNVGSFFAVGSSHLGDVGNTLDLNVSGADDLGRSGVQDLHSDGEQKAGSEGHALSESIIQVLVLVHQRVLTSGAIHVDPGWAHSGQEPWRMQTEKKR